MSVRITVLSLILLACSPGRFGHQDGSAGASASPDSSTVPASIPSAESQGGRHTDGPISITWNTRVKLQGIREAISVRDWLRAHGVAASRIIADTVPPAWLLSGQKEAPEEPKCFATPIGSPEHDGLVCKHPLVVEDDTLSGSGRLMVWRIENDSLRRVLDIHTFGNPDVRIEGTTRLSLDFGIKNWGDVSEQSRLGLLDPVAVASLWQVVDGQGSYTWDGTRFVQVDRPTRPKVPSTLQSPKEYPGPSECNRESQRTGHSSAGNACTVQVRVREWLAAQNILPGDVQAAFIPYSWVAGEANAEDPRCEAVLTGVPAKASLLCSEAFGKLRDPRWPKDRKWVLWRAADSSLAQVWSGRQSLDGTTLSLRFFDPLTFRINEFPGQSCVAMEKKLYNRYKQIIELPEGEGLPWRHRGAIRGFCAQRGKFTWNGTRFTKE